MTTIYTVSVDKVGLVFVGIIGNLRSELLKIIKASQKLTTVK